MVHKSTSWERTNLNPLKILLEESQWKSRRESVYRVTIRKPSLERDHQQKGKVKPGSGEMLSAF